MKPYSEVADFLGRFKVASGLGFFHMVSRDKTMNGPATFGLTPNDAKDLTASLTPANYCSGPEADHVGSGEGIWVFGTDIEQMEAYIKLKLVQDPREKNVLWAKVLAFHPAERALNYPLKRRGS